MVPTGPGTLLEFPEKPVQQAPRGVAGVDPAGLKHVARVRVPEDAALVLYTDGLVERRREVLDVGLHRLEGALTSGSGAMVLPTEIVAAMDDSGPNDDTVVLVVRLR